MAETFSTSEFVVPGTFVRVRAEGLISVGGISSGNIGIVGTASRAINETHNLSDYDNARETFGPYDAYSGGEGNLNLTRALEVLFSNGARTVYARAVAADANQAAFSAAFGEVIKDNVNILVAPELSTTAALSVLGSIVETAENNSHDLIAVIGSDAATVAAITEQAPTNDRIIFTTPGFQAFDAAANEGAGEEVDLSSTYSAAAIAGLLSTLTPQSSPTNKVLSGVVKLSHRYSYGEIRQLLNGRVLVLEQRRGIRVVRGLTTDDGAFTQITTRRITDFAKAGIRKASNPFIGKLNNQRVRKALQGAIDGFLTTMVQDEALTEYTLEVTATREDEIAGRAIVTVMLKPTFSIDFIAVTLVLQ